MSKTVIAFPGAYANSGKGSPTVSRDGLGPTIDVALRIHTCIVQGLHLGRFDGLACGPAPILADALIRTYGTDDVLSAQEQFERIYGCDPYTFLERMTRLRSQDTATESRAI